MARVCELPRKRFQQIFDSVVDLVKDPALPLTETSTGNGDTTRRFNHYPTAFAGIGIFRTTAHSHQSRWRDAANN